MFLTVGCLTQDPPLHSGVNGATEIVVGPTSDELPGLTTSGWNLYRSRASTQAPGYSSPSRSAVGSPHQSVPQAENRHLKQRSTLTSDALPASVACRSRAQTRSPRNAPFLNLFAVI